MSLDQAMHPQTGFRPLLPQDQQTGLPLARTPYQPDTNLAFPPPEQQHFSIKQEAQEQSRPPGFPQPPPQAGALDFQSHLHQQLNGNVNQSVSSSPQDQAVAMQHLHNHLMWYEQNFGNGPANPQQPNPNMQTTPFVQVSHPIAGDMAAPVFISQPTMSLMPSTPNSQGHAQTVPNTPQNHVQSWPSSPPSHVKDQRSQSYQLDVAPMPQNQDGSHFTSQSTAFSNGSFSYAGEQDYAASAYSSSVADPSSPPHQHSTPMPTLFEEGVPGYDESVIYQAAGGAEQDFNSPHFMMAGGPMCPEQAALDAAGIDATYIDTGISEEQINSWLVHPTGKGDAYRCKWEGCDTEIKRKENARSHVQNHLDDRRFRCNPCGKRFNRLHDTKRHHLTHTNERPAICPCGKTFARADALTRHRQRDMCEGVLPGFEKLEEEKPKRGRPKKERSEGDRSKRSNRPDMDTRARKAALARSLDHANANEGLAESMSSAASERSMPDTPPQDSDELDAGDFLNMDSSNGHFNMASTSWIDTPPTSPPSAVSTKHSQSKIRIDFSIPEEPTESVSPSKLSRHSTPSALPGAASSYNDGSSPVANNSSFNDYSGSGGFAGESSPADGGVDIFNDTVNFDSMNSHPDVGREIFSPPGESCSGSSVYNSDWDTVHVSSVKTTRGMAPSTMYSESFGATQRTAFGIDDFLAGIEEEDPYSDNYNDVRDILDSWVTTN